MRWIPVAIQKPAPEDGDEQGCVLAWHRYQGAMVLRVSNVLNYGTYITHWMPLPKLTVSASNSCRA